MKKILYIAHESTVAGGANNSLIDMINALGNIVAPVVIIPSDGEMSEKLNELNIKYYIVNMSRGIIDLRKTSFIKDAIDFNINYSAGKMISKIIKKENIDLVHINSSVCNAGAIGAILAGVPYVWHVREMIESQFNLSYLDIEFKKFLFLHAASVISISQTVKKDLWEKYGIESIVVYNAINPDRYYEDLSTKKFNDNNIILAGAVCEIKGQLEAIKAIKILKGKGIDNVRLNIVGRSGFRFKWCLKKYIEKFDLSDNIFLIDHKNDLRNLRAESSYALVTSKNEALGRVTVESMYAGNLIIGANKGGTYELLGNDEYGYIYEEGQCDSLAEKIEYVLSVDSDTKIKILKKAQEYAMRYFSKEKYANEILNIYTLATNNYEYDRECNSYIEKTKVNYQARLVDLQDIEVLNDNVSVIKWSYDIDAITVWARKLPNNISIYGMGKLGCELYDLLISLEKSITYVIDRNDYFIRELMDVYTETDNLPDTECIIITALNDYKTIMEKLKKYKQIKIVRIDDYLCQ